MLALLVLATAVSNPDPAGLGSDGAIGAALLARSASVARAGDVASRDRWLRAWASLGATPAAPDALAAPAEAARRWAAQEGAFRLFASRHGDRLKIGLHDPSAIVTRVEAFAREGDSATALARAEDEAPGRLEVTVDPAIGRDARFEVRAWCDHLGEPLLVRRVLVGTSAAAPAAPDPNSVRAQPPRMRREAEVGPAEDGGFPWWVVVVGAVAAGMTGAAVWQETRD